MTAGRKDRTYGLGLARCCVAPTHSHGLGNLDILLLYLLCLGGGEPGELVEKLILFSPASTGKVAQVGLWPSQCSTWVISEDGWDGVSTAKLSLSDPDESTE